MTREAKLHLVSDIIWRVCVLLFTAILMVILSRSVANAMVVNHEFEAVDVRVGEKTYFRSYRTAYVNAIGEAVDEIDILNEWGETIYTNIRPVAIERGTKRVTKTIDYTNVSTWDYTLRIMVRYRVFWFLRWQTVLEDDYAVTD